MTQPANRPIEVEVLSFEGCPNAEPARERVKRLVAEASMNAEIRSVDVPDPETAEQLRFLGSPSVRVAGRDVEPGAAERTDFVLSCRVYRTGEATSGVPSEESIRAALADSSA